MKNKKITYITGGAVLAALYAVLTLLGNVFGLSYGAVQFRFAEALCVLPVFSGVAVPGLTLGCFAANLLSTVSPLDTVFGTLATFLSAILTRKLRHITVKNYPFLSFLSPVLINGVVVGAEIAFFTSRETFCKAFFLNFLTVSLGEAVVVFAAGSALFVLVNKNSRLKSLLKNRL